MTDNDRSSEDSAERPVGADLAEPALDEPALTLPVSEPPPRASVGVGIAAFAIVLLVGGSVALLMTREPRYPDVEPAAPRAMSITEAAPAPSAPVSTAIAPAPAPATAPLAAAAPAQIAGSAAVTASPLSPAAPPAGRPAVAAPRLATLEARRPPPPPRLDEADLCASLPPAARARCADRPLGDADARLADAFDNAVDAGVPWPVLRRYRAAWDGLRSRATRDPAAVANTYDVMAEELDDLSARAFGPG